MLKRHNFHIDDWQIKYLKDCQNYSGLSMSEIVRADISMMILRIAVHYGYKPQILHPDDMFKNSFIDPKPDISAFRSMLENLTHEARIASDFLMAARSKSGTP